MTSQVLVIQLVFYELTLIRWNRISFENSGNVLRKSVINSTLFKDFLVSRVKLNLNGVIVSVFNELMVRNVVIHSAVPTLRHMFLTLWIPLLVSTAIHRLLNNRPSEIIIRQLTFLNRTSS